MNDIEQYVQDDKLRATMDSISQTEKGHGRIETRSVYTSDDVACLPGRREWPALKQTCSETSVSKQVTLKYDVLNCTICAI